MLNSFQLLLPQHLLTDCHVTRDETGILFEVSDGCDRNTPVRDYTLSHTSASAALPHKALTYLVPKSAASGFFFFKLKSMA